MGGGWLSCLLLLVISTLRIDGLQVAKNEEGVGFDACSVMCSLPAPAPNLFSTPQDGPLPLVIISCEIRSNNTASSHCALDVKNLTLGDTRTDSTTISYMRVQCSERPLHVHLSNPTNLRLQNAIGYLHLDKCSIGWSDLALYGEIVDFRVLYLIETFDTFAEETKIPSSPFFNRTSHGAKPLPLPDGLATIGTLTIQDQKQENATSFSDIFLDYEWPLLAEIAISMVPIDSIPDRLAVTMPNLQSLEINHGSRLTRHNNLFPWADDPLYLPNNLTRTPNTNQHYSTTFKVAPNIYRRVINYEYCQISDLNDTYFQGYIQKITLGHNIIGHMNPGVFARLRGVEHLDLSHNRLTLLPRSVFFGLNDLRQLNLEDNLLEFLPSDTFLQLPSLAVLQLWSNRLKRIEDNTFSVIPSLELLDVSRNELNFVSDMALDAQSDTIKQIDFSHNQLTTFPICAFYLRECIAVDFSNNNFTVSSMMDLLGNLSYSYLIFQHRQSASGFDREPTPRQTKTLLLKNNLINTFPLDSVTGNKRYVLMYLMIFFDINTDGNPLICDCHMFDLFKFIQAQTHQSTFNEYNLGNWRCQYPPDLKDISLASLDNSTFRCPVNIDDCPKSCVCYSRSKDSLLQTDCGSSSLARLPGTVPNATKHLLMRGALLTELKNPPPYLSTLEVVDFSHNNITDISKEFAEAISTVDAVYLDHNRMSYYPRFLDRLSFSSSIIRVGHNPILCDCHSRWVKDWLLSLSNVITDKEDVVCASGSGQGEPLLTVRMEDFICEELIDGAIRIVTIVLAVILFLLIIITLVTYRYRGEIKVFLFVRFKWHPFDKSDDLDDDKVYDAFVSYSGHDYRWVCHILRKKLEEGGKYRLCIHDRDFMVGTAIEENIFKSVKRSRRMILVLSRNFLNSEWCMLEFRAAHLKVLKERPKYLILVMFDDVSENELDDNLKLYTKTNTYLNIHNKWFWERLKYAMPETPLREVHPKVNDPLMGKLAFPVPPPGEKEQKEKEDFDNVTSFSNPNCLLELRPDTLEAKFTPEKNETDSDVGNGAAVDSSEVHNTEEICASMESNNGRGEA